MNATTTPNEFLGQIAKKANALSGSSPETEHRDADDLAVEVLGWIAESSTDEYARALAIQALRWYTSA